KQPARVSKRGPFSATSKAKSSCPEPWETHGPDANAFGAHRYPRVKPVARYKMLRSKRMQNPPKKPRQHPALTSCPLLTLAGTPPRWGRGPIQAITSARSMAGPSNLGVNADDRGG